MLNRPFPPVSFDGGAAAPPFPNPSTEESTFMGPIFFSRPSAVNRAEWDRSTGNRSG